MQMPRQHGRRSGCTAPAMRVQAWHSVLPFVLATALLVGAAPAQASEVVKLARLVITGQRLDAQQLGGEQARLERKKLPTVVVEGQRSEDGVQLAGRPRSGMSKAL